MSLMAGNRIGDDSGGCRRSPSTTPPIRASPTSPPSIRCAGGGRSSGRPAPPGSWSAEGSLAVRRLIASGRPLRAVLVDETQHAALADVLDGDRGARLPRLAGADRGHHRLRRSTAARSPPPTATTASRRPTLVEGARTLAVLEAISDLENLGAIFRNAAAFGIDGVLLDPRCADPFARRSVRVSMGHVLTVPWARAAGVAGRARRPARGRLHRRGADTGAPRRCRSTACPRGRIALAPRHRGRPASTRRRWPRPTCACGSRWRPASTRSTSPPPVRLRSTASLRQSRNERRLHRRPRRPGLVRAARAGLRDPGPDPPRRPRRGPLLHPAVRRGAGQDAAGDPLRPARLRAVREAGRSVAVDVRPLRSWS